MTTPVGEPHFFVTRSWRDLAEGRLPDRQVLDRATRGHPVMIQAWAPVTPNVIAFNTAALHRLGLDERHPPRRRRVDREGRARDAHRDPDRLGDQLLQLRQLQQLAVDADPVRPDRQVVPATVRAMRQYNAQGVTPSTRTTGWRPRSSRPTERSARGRS